MRIRRSPVLLMTLGNGLPPGAGRTPPTVRRATESAGRQGEGWSKTQLARVLFSGNANPGDCYEGELERDEAGDVALPPAADALRPDLALAWKPMGAGEWRSSHRVGSRGRETREAARRGNWRGNWRGTQSGQWLRRQPPHRGNCAATVSVRSAIAVRPEQEEAAVPLPGSSSYAAVAGKQPELDVRCNRRVQRVRSRFSRSAVKPKSKGRGSWVASQSLGSPPVSGTAVSSGSAVKRDSRVAVLCLSATSVILVLVVGMPRRG